MIGYYQNQYAYYGAGPGPAVTPRQDKRNTKRTPDEVGPADVVVDETVVTTGGKDVTKERLKLIYFRHNCNQKNHLVSN